MADKKDIVKLAVDFHRGCVEKFSVDQAKDVLRQALIEANGGSSALDIRRVRDGKCGELFSIIEEVLHNTVIDELPQDPMFDAIVEYRNVGMGDQNLFVIEDEDLFFVAAAADGTQGIRRQRLGTATDVAIPTVFQVVKIYDDLNRVLSGQVDLNYLIDRVSKSFRAHIYSMVQDLWNSVTQDDLHGAKFYPTAGTYNEADLLDVIANVEAASGGKQATIIGTKKALRVIAPAIQGVESKSDLYNNGYYGKFYGTPVVALTQTYKPGTQTMAYPDDVLTIIATEDRPIKVVIEGDPLVILGNPLDKPDMTQEYMFGEKIGVGLVMANNTGVGRYEW